MDADGWSGAVGGAPGRIRTCAPAISRVRCSASVGSAPGRIRTCAPAISRVRCSASGGQRPWQDSNLRSRDQQSAVLGFRWAAPLAGFEPALPRSAECGARERPAPAMSAGRSVGSAPGRIRTCAPAISRVRCSASGGQRPWQDSNLRSRDQQSAVLGFRWAAPLAGFEPALPRSAECGARLPVGSAPGRIRTCAPAISRVRCSASGGQRPGRIRTCAPAISRVRCSASGGSAPGRIRTCAPASGGRCSIP